MIPPYAPRERPISTVTKTREATEEALVSGIFERCKSHLKRGVTTIEVKSGYGLCVTEELKMLRAIRKANESIAQDLISTCLAAHMKPKDWEGTAETYLLEIANTLFPILKSERLTYRVDAFIEERAFSKESIAP
mgnify:FL=1